MSTFLMLPAVFCGALVVAYFLIMRVPPKLHTPLMSLTNAISAVTVIGALLVFARPTDPWQKIAGGLALAAVAFNLFGGFALTHRILKMFRE